MVTGAYSPEVSGAGLQCRTLVRALGDRVRFVVFTTTSDPTMPARDAVDGVPVYRCLVQAGRWRSKLEAALRFVVLFWRCRGQFHVVHLHGFSKKTFLFFLLARALGKKLVLKMTSIGHDDPVSIAAKSRLGFWLFGRVDCAVSVSPALSARYQKSGLPSARLREIPNGVDVERFCPATPDQRIALRRALRLAEDLPVVLFVGFFSRDKAPDVLFEAWRRIRAESVNAVLVFVGATRGPYYELDPTLVERIRRETASVGLEDDVVFVDRAVEIERYYKAADVFVLPSLREGLPNALLEAMAAGLACVSTRLPGVTDWLIRHGDNGLLFPPGDVATLADHLCRLVAHPDHARTLGARARQTVVERCSLKRVGDDYLDLYSWLVGRGGIPCAGSPGS